MRHHFVQQMFSGAAPARSGGQKFPWHRASQLNAEMPAAFVKDGTGNQFRLMTEGQPHRAGGHPKSPARSKRHVHLFARRVIQRDQQRVSRREKFRRRAQPLQGKYGWNFRERGKPVRPLHQLRAILRPAADEGRGGDAGGAQPCSQQKNGPKWQNASTTGRPLRRACCKRSSPAMWQRLIHFSPARRS
jgi:hypothetical protein